MDKQWNAVILAGDRGPNDPVASAAGVEGKAFVALNSNTLLEDIISVLHASESINNIYAVGPKQEYLNKYPSIQSHIEQHQVHVIEPADGPSASAMRGVMFADNYPTLIVTCDLVFINTDLIDQYCKLMSNVNADFVACAIDYEVIHAQFPQLKKTQYTFAQRAVCFANVFAVLSPQGLKALDYWQEIEKSRKNPIQLIRKIDWLSLINYKLGRLSLDQVAAKLSGKVGAQLAIESMPHAELAIDLDSAEDYYLIKDTLRL